jgi:hypothetical protein
MKVYQTINAIQQELAKEGISKDGRNTQGAGYNFRGIDQVLNVLSPLLAKHKLCILPRVLERESVERASKSGGALYFVALKMEFDFVSAEDGSKHTVCTCGEAMDSSDKATNKAMSAAYKYAAIQTFCIPTEGDNDADAHTHEPVAVITVDQLTHIQDCIKERGVDTTSILQWLSKGAGYQITTLSQTPAAAYSALVKRLTPPKKD